MIDFSQPAGFELQEVAVGPVAETYQFSPAATPGTHVASMTSGFRYLASIDNAAVKCGLMHCSNCTGIRHAQHLGADQVLCLAGATTPVLPSAVNASGCLYTTYMEHYGSAAQPAVTNMETVVIVASFDTNVSSLLPAAVQLQLDNGQNGTVSDVQAFPGQPNVFLIEVCHIRNSVYLLPFGLPELPVLLPANLGYNVMHVPNGCRCNILSAITAE